MQVLLRSEDRRQFQRLTPALCLVGSFLVWMGGLAAPAHAQDIDAFINAAPDSDEPEPLSELEALSQSTDEGLFPGFNESPDREPISLTVRALNKVTAKFTDLTIPIDETATFGTLSITPRYCDTRPPEEFPETTAFLQIRDGNRQIVPSEDDAVIAGAENGRVSDDQAIARRTAVRAEQPGQPPQASERPAPNGQQDGQSSPASQFTDEATGEATSPYLFSGWMFASSPALNPLEHAVYDVWVITCETRLADRDE